jgi:nitrite reductase (NADH) small subunit
MTTHAPADWAPVCRHADLTPERGVAALVDGRQIAIFLLHDGTLHAVDHRDPYTGSNVIARGIVGTRVVDGQEVPTVASPLHKQVYDLHSGICLDDPELTMAVHRTRTVDGVVEVGLGAGVPEPAVPA